jgi:hypothetical protein
MHPENGFIVGGIAHDVTVAGPSIEAEVVRGNDSYSLLSNFDTTVVTISKRVTFVKRRNHH